MIDEKKEKETGGERGVGIFIALIERLAWVLWGVREIRY